MNRPGDPLANLLTDIAYGAVLGQGYYIYLNSPERVVCPKCGRTVSVKGLNDHMKAKHPEGARGIFDERKEHCNR